MGVKGNEKVENAAQEKNRASDMDEAVSKRQKNGTRKVLAVGALTAVSFLPMAQEAQADEIPGPETTSVEDGNLKLQEFDSIKEPLVRTLHEGDGVVRLAEAMVGEDDREAVFELTADILEANGYTRPDTRDDLGNDEYKKIKAGQELIIPIEADNTYVIKPGDTAGKLYRSLGWEAAGYSFDEFKRQNAIIDKDKIYGGEEMLFAPELSNVTAEAEPAKPPAPGERPVPVDPVPQPETTPVLPPNTKSKVSEPEQSAKPEPDMDEPPEAPAIVTTGKEIKDKAESAGRLEIDEAQIELDNGRYMDREEAQDAVDLMIEATRKLENPLYRTSINLGEDQPESPTANTLEEQRNDWIDKLVSGEVNVAYMQGWTIKQLSKGYDGNIHENVKMGVALSYVDYIAERNGWKLTDTETNELAKKVIRGVGDFHPHYLRFAELNGVDTDELDRKSLTLDLINESIEAHLEEQMELVRLSDEQLETLDSKDKLTNLDETDYEKIARAMIEAKRTGKTTDDYPYEVLKFKLDGMDIKEGLKLVARGVLTEEGSADLLKLFPDFNDEVSRAANEWIETDDGKELTSFIERVDELHEAKVTDIQKRAESLGDLQVDIDQLNPALEELDGETLYEIAKALLSQEENGEDGPDEWFYIIESKAHQEDAELRQTIIDTVKGVYAAQGAEELWRNYRQERKDSILAVDSFLEGEDKNLKNHLDGVFEDLEARLGQSEDEVRAVLKAVQTALPNLELSNEDLTAIAIDNLIEGGVQNIADALIAEFENDNQRELSSAELAVIDLEMIKLQAEDRNEELSLISAYLMGYYGEKGALTSIQAVEKGDPVYTDYDPAIQTIARMISEGRYEIDYDGKGTGLFSEEFEGKLRNYYGQPGHLFPGQQWLIKGYGGEDLTPLFDYLDLDAEKILDNPFNESLANQDGKIVATGNGSIWFDASLWEGGEEPDFEQAVEWVYGEIPGFPYTVKKGDTYSSIAQMFRIDGQVPDWKDIIEHNRGRIPDDPTKLKIGQDIVLPPEWKVHIDLSFPEPVNKEAGAVSSGNYSENLFQVPGKQIKEKLKEDAPNGESGHLKPEQLDKLGSEWGDHLLHPDAAEAFRQLSSAFEDEFGKSLEVVSSYRSYEGQVATKKWWEDRGKGGYAATPGKSNHGWGLAIDFGDQDHNGSEGAGLKFSQEEYEWLRDNSKRFGWENPDWAHDGQGVEEAWHFEYVDKPEMSSSASHERNYPVLERYEPGSQEFVQLFAAAAEHLGLPSEWASSDSLHKLVSHESGGWVGIPNYTYGDRKEDRGEWHEIHEELKDGEITAKSSATGLGQLLSKNATKYYPSGADGIGVGFEEAVGTLAYIKNRYGNPDTAWGNHSANPDRWEGVEKIYESEGY